MLDSHFSNNYMDNFNNDKSREHYDDHSTVRIPNGSTEQLHGTSNANRSVIVNSKELTQTNQIHYFDHADANKMNNIHHPNNVLLSAHNPITHGIKNLSSPESAYSTGYSTDGTSPGKNSISRRQV